MPRSRRVVALAALVLALAACTGPASQPSPAATTVVTPTPTRPAPVALFTGSVTVTAQPLDAGAVATGTPADDGTVRLSVSSGDAVLAAPPGSSFRALDDGSAVVDDAAGAFQAGLTPSAPGTRLVQASPTSVRLVGTAPTDVWLASIAVQDAVWGDAEGGRSLAVTPSAWARAGGRAAQDGLWTQLVAREPDADTPSMRAQLECHELGAPDKATWNLEPWRPDVSAVKMIAARCNPE